jgi:uncharacterized protein (DUF1330 family)
VTDKTYLEPTHGAGRALVMRVIPGEVVMLNLLRFRPVADYSASPELVPPEPITGEEAYRRYMEHTEPFLKASGGDVLFTGRGGPFLIGPPEERWDAALLVRQRSVADFISFAQNPEYLAGMGHRQAALDDSRLLPLSEWKPILKPVRPEVRAPGAGAQPDTSDSLARSRLTPRFTEALTLACVLHRSQVRKGTYIPYVSHLLGVASLALEHGATEDEAIAALLHDAVEDQGGAATAALIQDRFGAAVADIVRACSDTDEVPKPPWRARKEAYVEHVGTASASVRLVSASDKLHNARSIFSDYRAHGDRVWDRFSGGRDGTLWYYRALVDAFSKHGRSSLIDELDRVVTELEQLCRSASR